MLLKTKTILTHTKGLWLLVCVCVIHIKLTAQFNLVPNYSFENYINCPSSTSDLPPANWYIPTLTSVNYQSGFYSNSCSTEPCFSVPYNCLGLVSYQMARTGQAYGIFTSYSAEISQSDERNYWQVKLIDSMKSGKRFIVTFYVSLCNPLKFATNNISLFFSKNSVYPDTLFDPRGIISANPQITNYGNPIIADTLNWVKISSVFTAQGGERYVTIGNFQFDNQTIKKVVNTSIQTTNGAEYYIDDVSVIPLDSMCLKADAGRDTTINAGDSVFIGSLTNGLDSVKWYANGTSLIDSIRPGFWVHPIVTTSYILQQVVNGCFSSDTIKVTVGAVPLKFTNYELRFTNDRHVENRWTTANEVNVSHFNIQRSNNGKDFTTIGKTNAKGFSFNEYSFIDETPNEGVNYYRVESVDRDEKKQYSEVRTLTINHSSLTTIDVYPNPTTGYVYIDLPNKERACWQITATDIYGKRVAEKEVRANIGKTFINLKGTTGIYFINVLNCSTGKQQTAKVILQ